MKRASRRKVRIFAQLHVEFDRDDFFKNTAQPLDRPARKASPPLKVGRIHPLTQVDAYHRQKSEGVRSLPGRRPPPNPG